MTKANRVDCSGSDGGPITSAWPNTPGPSGGSPSGHGGDRDETGAGGWFVVSALGRGLRPALTRRLGQEGRAARLGAATPARAGHPAPADHLTRRLQAAGACSVAVTSIAGHFCIEAFERVSSLPVINLLSVVNDGVQAPATGSPLCRGEPLSDGLPRGGRRPVRASTPLVRLLIRGLASRRRGASSPRSAPRRPARLVAVKAEVPGRGRRIRVR